MLTRIVQLLLCVALSQFPSASASACSFPAGAQFLSGNGQLTTLPPDVAFSFWVLEDETPVEFSLTTAAGLDVALEVTEKLPSRYAADYWTLKPTVPLATGRYVLTASPSAGPTRDSFSEVVEFEVREEARHPELPPIELRLSGEETNNPDTCSSEHGGYQAYLDLQSDEPLHEIAYLIVDIEKTDGTSSRRAMHLRTAPTSAESWPAGTTGRLSVNLKAAPDCAWVTAVLSAGRRVDLGEACARSITGGGAGCVVSGAEARARDLWLVAALLAFGRRRRRCQRESSRSEP